MQKHIKMAISFKTHLCARLPVLFSVDIYSKSKQVEEYYCV